MRTLLLAFGAGDDTKTSNTGLKVRGESLRALSPELYRFPQRSIYRLWECNDVGQRPQLRVVAVCVVVIVDGDRADSVEHFGQRVAGVEVTAGSSRTTMRLGDRQHFPVLSIDCRRVAAHELDVAVERDLLTW